MTYIRLCADVDWIYGTVSCWFWTNRRYVGISTCLNLLECLITWYTVYDALPTIVKSPAIQLQWQWYTYGSALMLTQYMERYHVGFGRTGRTLVLGFSTCLDLNVPLLGVHNYTRTHLLLKYATMTMTYGYALMLMLIEYMERYRVDFERTGRTLVLVHVWIRICHCLAYDALWHHRNCTLACYSTAMTMANDSALMLMLNYYGTVLCWLWTKSWYVDIY